MPLEAGFLEGWLEAWHVGWSDHDADRLVALCAADVRIEDPSLPGPLHGRDGMRRFASATFRAFPDARSAARDGFTIAADGTRAFAPSRLTGRFDGPWEPLGIAATGARVQIDSLDELAFADGELCLLRAHYDGLALARQMRTLPQLGSLQHRMLMRLQRMQAPLERRRARRRG
jgi:predicted ester cyclase